MVESRSKSRQLKKQERRQRREEKRARGTRRQRLERAYFRKREDGTGRVYDSFGEVRWGKLDNAAHLFPAIAGEGMSNVYRVAAYLDEEIDGDRLREALAIVLPKFPVFNVRLRQGVFWYYFEENGKEPPPVVEENTYPCQYIEENRNRNYLFRVTYYGTRINLEAFHVLTDGTGAMFFLKELTYQYLRLAHPALRELYGDALSSETSLNTEDSFLANYKKERFAKGYKSFRAHLLKGTLFPTGKMGILHGHMPVDEVRAAARQYDATINEYLVAAFLWSAYRTGLKGQPSKRPLTAAVPVNLRPYFDSVTARNFFVMVTAVFWPKQSENTFADVVEAVKTSLAEQLTREHLESVISYNMAGEQMMILRAIPLFLKNPGLRGIYNLHAKANTTTVTNLGRITAAPEYREYIRRFDVLLSRSKGQSTKVTLSTYEGMLTATITSVLRDVELQRDFYRFLAAEGIAVTIDSNRVYYEEPSAPAEGTPIYPYLSAERGIRKMQRALRVYVAAAVAAVVILILADIAAQGSPGWVILIGIFLAYGYLTLKVSISMHTGYRLIVFLQCVLGVAVLFSIDMVSGFQGWSLTYIIPAACMLIDLAIVVMMIVNSRDWQSYIPLLLLTLAFSVLPPVLFAVGLVTHLVVPVIGLTLVALTFAGALIAGGRRARDELYRRFRA